VFTLLAAELFRPWALGYLFVSRSPRERSHPTMNPPSTTVTLAEPPAPAEARTGLEELLGSQVKT
jgi:hypothetical protein